jgi:menaquinol-cytochrome c reductase iron-sulfur subunit
MSETTNGQTEPAASLPPSRRKLLGFFVGAINFIIGATVIVPVLGFILSPLARKSRKEWVPVLDAAELAVGETKEASFVVQVRDGYAVHDRKYTVFLRRTAEGVVAFDPSCTHLGCRVRFQESKQRYFCPCHGGVFDADGKVVSGPPPRPLETHPVKVDKGRIWVERSV